MAKRLTTEEFVSRATKIHGNIYDYSKVCYINTTTKVMIGCEIHGEFQQQPCKHLQGRGCPMCGDAKGRMSRRKTTTDFIEKSTQIHNGKYDYSLVEYTGRNHKVKIICKDHGEFYQKASHHLRGCGCPVCKTSKGEQRIKRFLDDNNLSYTQQHKFYDCIGIKNQLPFDFYIPSLNMCIEYDGEQHYVPKIVFGGEAQFIQTQQNDRIKTQYCDKNNIILIRIPYMDFDNIEHILSKSIGYD